MHNPPVSHRIAGRILSRFYRKIGSWLGLLAILMATLAPTISHTLAARDAAKRDAGRALRDGVDGLDGSMSMDVHAADGLDVVDATTTQLDDARSRSARSRRPASQTHATCPTGDACGYCSLLAHLPVMPGVETLFVVAVRAREQHRRDPLRKRSPRRAAHLRAAPRTSVHRPDSSPRCPMRPRASRLPPHVRSIVRSFGHARRRRHDHETG